MQAYVLSAGFGTRLGNLTQDTPKPMLDVVGRPLLEYIIRHLAWCEFDPIGINLHFLPQAIRDHFGSGASMGLELVYSYEAELLGTAGGVKKMSRFMPQDDHFLVHYGDVLTDHDFSAMLRFHRQRRAMVTMMVHERPGSNSVVGLDSHGRVEMFLERPTESQRQGITTPWVNSGVWICSAELLDQIPGRGACDLARDILPPLVSTGRVFAYPLDGYRCAIDSPARLSEARSAVAEGRCRLRWRESFGTKRAA